MSDASCGASGEPFLERCLGLFLWDNPCQPADKDASLRIEDLFKETKEKVVFRSYQAESSWVRLAAWGLWLPRGLC